MKFAEIIRNAGLNPEDFPKSSKVDVDLFDVKERLIKEPTISFAENLFEHNQRSKERFAKFVADFEESVTDTSIPHLQMKIDENALYTIGAKAQIFSRVHLEDI